jgi:hypothetical protein
VVKLRIVCCTPLDRVYKTGLSFIRNISNVGATMVLRDNAVEVIFAAWRVLFDCGYSLEVELMACVEGFNLDSNTRYVRKSFSTLKCHRLNVFVMITSNVLVLVKEMLRCSN